MEILSKCLSFFGIQGFLLGCLVFIPLERILTLRDQQRVLREGWRNDLVYVFVNGAVVRAGLTVLLIGAAPVLHWLMHEEMRTTIANQSYWLQTIAAIIVADLGFYVAHRAFHSIPLLWRFHAIHHSIEELDWLAAARVHPVDQIVTKGVSLLPLIALGFDAVPIAIFSTIYFWHSLLLHANVRLSVGPLGWLIASPAFHHWHHAHEPAAHNKNYAGQLAILDTMFGTLFLPRGRMPARYGLNTPTPQTYLQQIAHPFRR